MNKSRRAAALGGAPRRMAACFAVLVVALLFASPLSLNSLTRDTAAPQRELVGTTHADLATPTSTAFAIPSARSYLRRTNACSLRACIENTFFRVLALAMAAVSLIAWRRYVAGRRESGNPSPRHAGSIYLLRGPPACPSRYSPAVVAGDRPMDTTREEWTHAIRYRIDARNRARTRCFV